MYTASERIRHVHAHLHRVPHVLDHTPAFEQLMLGLRHQPLHVSPRRNVQPLLDFEEPRQFILLQKISRITDKEPLEVHNEIAQSPVVMHVPRGEVDTLQIAFGSTDPMQLEPISKGA